MQRFITSAGVNGPSVQKLNSVEVNDSVSQMKALASFFVFLTAFATTQAQEAVRPSVASEFGKQITVQAEFVAKSNTYYAQNLVSEPYVLRVVSVDGRQLQQSVLIEYRLVTEKKERSKIERAGIVQTFEAYESLYQPAFSTPWLADGEQGMSFALVHLLYVRPPQKKG